MNTKVPTPEPKGYAVTAAELRRLADALDTLPPGDKPLYTHISILPGASTVEVLDPIAVAVTGKPGEAGRHGDGWLYRANTHFGDEFYVAIQATVPGPPDPPDPKDVELARLRAEVAELRGDRTGLKFSREAEDPTPGDVPSGVAGGSVTGRASVPDTLRDAQLVQWRIGNRIVVGEDRDRVVCDEEDAYREQAARASVPDMPTRPQCSPACRDLYRPDRGVHFLGCPNFSTPMAEPSGGN